MRCLDPRLEGLRRDIVRLERIDRLLKPRLRALTVWPFNRLGAALCLVMAMASILYFRRKLGNSDR